VGPAATAKQGSSKKIILVLGCIGAAILIGIFLVGMFAAILIPNFLNALHKAKQKRAMAELQTMGRAIERYQAEHGYAPAATDMPSLGAALDGRSSSPIPRLDPWQHPYRYACWQESPAAKGCDHYRIASGGRDGKFAQADLKDYRPIEFAPGEYDSDIVYGDDAFIARPQAR
jgi:type II secretory pathway pseudopilin PulG